VLVLLVHYILLTPINRTTHKNLYLGLRHLDHFWMMKIECVCDISAQFQNQGVLRLGVFVVHIGLEIVVVSNIFEQRYINRFEHFM
jgi:hypothetical protein